MTTTVKLSLEILQGKDDVVEWLNSETRSELL